jgi:hypothetical protein
MVQKRALEGLQTKLASCKVTPEAVCSIVKSLTKRGGPNAPSAIHGFILSIFDPLSKAGIISDCLENQFRAHDL